MAAYRRNKRKCEHYPLHNGHIQKELRCPCGSWGKKSIRTSIPLSQYPSRWANLMLKSIRKWNKKRDSRRAAEALKKNW